MDANSYTISSGTEKCSRGYFFIGVCARKWDRKLCGIKWFFSTRWSFFGIKKKWKWKFFVKTKPQILSTANFHFNFTIHQKIKQTKKLAGSGKLEGRWFCSARNSSLFFVFFGWKKNHKTHFHLILLLRANKYCTFNPVIKR